MFPGKSSHTDREQLNNTGGENGGNMHTSDSPNESERLRNIILEFTDRPKEHAISEVGIQKLVYITDVYCAVYYGKRITNTDFKRYQYGAYSEEIHEILESSEEIGRKPVIQNRVRSVEYWNRGEGDLCTECKKITNTIKTKFRSYSEEELAKFSKQSWLYKNSNNGHIDFSIINTDLDSESKERIKKQFPGKVDHGCDLFEL